MTSASESAVDVVAPRGARGSDAALRWESVCRVDDLTPDRGVAALVDDAHVAVFLLSGGEVLAVDNLDPFSGASVLSRGIVGDIEGEPTVASPIYKQRFLLRTGRCVEDDNVVLGTWATRVVDGCVEVGIA